MSEKKSGLADKILNLPSEYLYGVTIILLFISVIFPKIPLASVSPYVENTYNWVNQNINPGDIVVFELGNDFAYYISHMPGVTAVLNHVMDTAGQKGGKIRLIVIGHNVEHMLIWRYAQQGLLKQTMDKWGYTYGKDYANLGIVPGGDAGLYVFAKNPYVGEIDAYGTQLKTLEVMKDFKDINNVKLWVQGNWDTMPEIRQITGPYKTAYIFVGHPEAAVSSPIWVDSNQMTGFVAGWPGAQMYEFLVNKPGLASFGSMTISVAYLILLVSIVICNILYLSKKVGGA